MGIAIDRDLKTIDHLVALWIHPQHLTTGIDRPDRTIAEREVTADLAGNDRFGYLSRVRVDPVDVRVRDIAITRAPELIVDGEQGCGL
jgi:hypothetical protein